MEAFDSDRPDRSLGIAAADAITHARSAAAVVDSLADQISTVARRAARARAELATATVALAALTAPKQPRHNTAANPDAIEHLSRAHTELDSARTTLSALASQKQQLIAARDQARAAALEAEREAIAFAPQHRWDEIVARPGRFIVTADRADTHTTPSSPQAHADAAQLQQQLTRLHEERRRRENLTPQQNALEAHHRSTYMTESAAEQLDSPSPTTSPVQDLGL